MPIIYLIRHAQIRPFEEYTAETKLEDFELTEKGKIQARLLGEYLGRRRENFDEVYTGTSKRHIDTAEIVLPFIGDAVKRKLSVEVLPFFNEVDFGPRFVSLMLSNSLRKDEVLDAWTRNEIPEVRERVPVFRRRIDDAVEWLASRRTQKIAIFTSKAVVQSLIMKALGSEWSMTISKIPNINIYNTSISPLEISRERGIRLIGVNWVPHLNETHITEYQEGLEED